MELKTIAILGPGGPLGTAILDELLQQPSPIPFKTITLITRPTSSYIPPPPPSTSAPTLIHKHADYTSATSLLAAFSGQDAIVNCITGSATQYAAYRLIIDAALAAGVKLFFANEFVGNVRSPRYNRLPEGFVGAKARIRGELERMGGRGEMGWVGLNGGAFMDMWLTKGPGGFSLPTSHARIYGSGDVPLYWTPLPVLARAAVHMLHNPEPVMNRAIHICPFVARPGEPSCLTQRGLLRVLEEELGTKFEIEEVDVERIFRHAMTVLARYEKGEARGEGIAQAVKGLAVCNQFYEEEVGAGKSFSDLVENEVVGVETMDVRDAVRDAISRYGRDCAVVEGMFRVEACEV
ncbi:hypothetical protein COCCADRAFT_110442 [Bipolaris zeicola 26-R-13]|uniref:NmrA-like domain-containing protein n=1 Tax=Cochliobolus carbonum (strain 26-R-13) TaxID=930089 RepID=W6XYY3_COCC2|nr:uncharacterized protein COCCADRAFT_110442 [Bipolaris zeicola 26-R-13]EUC27934.1 hypothetical protein COCCADRAFT_110442 [Bipolaris zeicola 26-R-13]